MACRFCLSKARTAEDGVAAPPAHLGGGLRASELQALSELKPSELRRRAQAAGVDEEALDEALDAADTQAALLELIAARSAAGEDGGAAELRAELSKLKITTLIQRASAAGVEQAAIEQAEDSGDFHDSLVELIVQQRAATADGRAVQLRAELATLRLTTLIQRAAAGAVSSEELEAAEDETDHKGAVIELIVTAELVQADEASLAFEALRAELSAMRLTKLIARAVSAGVSTEDLERAEDDEKGHASALIDLVINTEAEARRGAAPGPAPAPHEHPRASTVLVNEAEAQMEPQPEPEPQRQLQPEPEPKPEPQLEPQPQPQPQPQLDIQTTAEKHKSAVREDPAQHPVYRTLQSHQLEEHFEKLLAMGVKRVEDLQQLNQQELSSLGMNRFDRQKFMTAYLEDTPHHGAVSKAKEDTSVVITSAGGFTFEAGDQHAMLSYQWDDQDAVLATRDHLRGLGVPTWMGESFCSALADAFLCRSALGYSDLSLRSHRH
jgi:hypothetical protein